MNIILHCPENPERMQALRERIGVVHAQAAARHLERLMCSRDQKMHLIKMLQEPGAQ